MLYKSCDFIQGGLHFLFKNVLMCCLSISSKNEIFPIIKNYNGESIDWDKLFKYKQKIKNSHKKGRITEICKGCSKLIEKDWEEKDTINHIVISHWAKCNCKCIYCLVRYDKNFYNTMLEPYKIMPVLNEMLEKKLIGFDGMILFGGGEPTQLEELDEILKFFTENNAINITLNSSGIEYSDAIAKTLSTNTLNLTISPDSGTEELYKKIKRTNTYETVWKNINRYCLSQGENKYAVKTKYILLPRINDNIDEIEQWIQKSILAGVKNIVLDIEAGWFCKNKHKIPPHIYDIISYVQKRASELNVMLSYYGVIEQLMYEKKQKEEVVTKKPFIWF